jgi:TolA-binding protein
MMRAGLARLAPHHERPVARELAVDLLLATPNIRDDAAGELAARWARVGPIEVTRAAVPALAKLWSERARPMFVAALASLKTGDAERAAREFADPVWAATPVPDYAALLLGQSLVKSGDLAGARAAATKAVDGALDGRPMPSMLQQAASVLSGAGDEAGAGALYRKFVERYPDSPEAPRARYAIALGLLSENKLPEATRAFGDVWLLSPSSPLARRKILWMCAISGRTRFVIATRSLRRP